MPLIHWLPLTERSSLHAGDLSARLRRQGVKIGIVDTLLAATALAHGLVMVTRNLRHFELVPGLTTENWFNTGNT